MITANIYRQLQSRSLARWVLLLFVLSVLNMNFQIPVHAAMQFSMQQPMKSDSINHAGMDHTAMMQNMDMSDCNCPQILCDSVAAQHDQLYQPFNTLMSFDLLNFHPIQIQVQQDTTQQLASVSLNYHNLHYRQTSPPPLRLTGILRI